MDGEAELLRAVREQDARAARDALAKSPGAAATSIYTACCVGDGERVERELAADPSLATAADERGWVPLLYVAASPLHGDDETIARGLVRAAGLLLDAGADPNSYTLFEGDDVDSRLTALYRACNVGNATVARLLLERGAGPNDGESVYHAAERNHRDCLELLLEHGADIGGANPTFGNTPLYFLAGYPRDHADAATVIEGMRWLLEHGADPNVPSLEVRETPLHSVARGSGGPAMAELLLEHGADPDAARADGRTAYALAVRAGNDAVVELLERHGVDSGRLSPVDELLGACMRADEGAVESILAAHPGLTSELTDDDRGMPAQAAYEGRADSLRLMADLGFDLGREGLWGGTPLHHAAWLGDVETVRTLLDLGAPVDVRDRCFGSSPLGWAAHGSCHCRRAGDSDYCTIVEALLDAGADRASSINRWDHPPEALSSAAVAELLRERGFAPQPE